MAGGAAFEGDLAIAYAANLRSRIASRVLLQVGERRCRDDDDLYKLARSLPWPALIDPRQTLRVDVSAIRSPLRSLNFATLRVKDGIVDQLREATGDRPSIDTRQPGCRVFAFLHERQATLYVDTSGESLFKRGWRSERDDHGEAPLKENLAAGLLALSGWTPDAPLYDPFCGSGTIVIEAAQRAFGIAPGVSRAFAFERLPGFDARLWASLRADAIRESQRAPRASGGTGAPCRIAASDVDPAAIARLRTNARRAGLPEHAIRAFVGDAASAAPPFEDGGWIVTNPPYGERIELAHGGSGWPAIGAAWRERYRGWHVAVLSSDRDLPRWLGMKERRKTPLYNGAIECRLFGFEVYDAQRVASGERHARPRDGETRDTVHAHAPDAAAARGPDEKDGSRWH